MTNMLQERESDYTRLVNNDTDPRKVSRRVSTGRRCIYPAILSSLFHLAAAFSRTRHPHRSTRFAARRFDHEGLMNEGDIRFSRYGTAQ